jgi:RecA-family ATPase
MVTAGPDAAAADSMPIIDSDEGAWNPCKMLSDYLGALFDDDDIVGYVVNCWEQDGELKPKKGDWSRTAGELRQELASPTATMDKVIGAWDERAGAWIRFNPLDGHGCGNANVTDYRYALVESDVLDLDKQFPAIKDMRLPCVAVVSSGGKSVHAIVRVDAPNKAEYDKRVRWLYDYCDRHGFICDKQNKNASRLSRMPGATRNGRRQLLLATDIGEPDWESWKRWAEESEDDLPDDEDSSDLDTPANLAPVLIEGIARQGQKIIVVGDSKMGKSTTLIDLAEAICVGGKWLGMQCAKGPVYYVNLEIDSEEFKERQFRIWNARPEFGDDSWNTLKSSFAKWNLKGHATLMKELVPRLVRRVLKRGPKGTFMAVIIDPVYKVNGGDDNDARAVAEFTNALDYICTTCGCAVIYAHHHPKGAAGGKKSMDRMSGTGVYARDADTVIDFTALEADEETRKRFGEAKLFRTTFTCRSFQDHTPLDVAFQYPRFYPDTQGILSKCHVEGEELTWQEKNEKRRQGRIEQADNERREKIAIVREALAMCEEDGVFPTRKNVLERLGEYDGNPVSQGTLTAWTSKGSKRALGPFSCEKDEATNRWLIYDDHSSKD